MAVAWAGLLELIDCICDALDGNKLTIERTAVLNKSLTDWHANLDAGFRPTALTAPAVHILHMQYNSALVLLNLALAGFGTDRPLLKARDLSILSSEARSTCIQTAVAMTELLQGYEEAHGEAFSMSGVALHPTSTAATVLTSEIVDRKGLSGTESDPVLTAQHIRCLKRCIKALSEMEESYPVSRRVRKIIQLIMRLSNVSDRMLPKPNHGEYAQSASQSPGLRAQRVTANVAVATIVSPENPHYSNSNDPHAQHMDTNLPDHEAALQNLPA